MSEQRDGDKRGGAMDYCEIARWPKASKWRKRARSAFSQILLGSIHLHEAWLR
jgi:hypothetical protein